MTHFGHFFFPEDLNENLKKARHWIDIFIHKESSVDLDEEAPNVQALNYPLYKLYISH